ncbi:DeoR/GlpR family DNA-binding transcription regulator [Nocardioides bruguierae]|uniref:Lactose phosphotransferase system repressor n=1 Tax=Nocardioides bruguierae TaxID=2945102 RepID=A0A9X2DA97_9ACTN|nr:DeoR/GlpR family DNA-binding transcription regulator [Nocardioides bruguierae]MCM0622230.1 DeoR/GlpR family DNA-binding transcription regulator [Nocardioides bruguierae]
MYAEERQQAMARLVAERGRLSVAALAEAYDVTTETVRRDLSTLERMGLLRRVHGGAVPASSLAVMEAALSERDLARTDEKDRIAAATVDLLPPSGGTLLVDAGSTTARIAAHIPRDLRVSVFTHSVSVASRLAGHPAVELHLLPGRVRGTTQAAVGPDTVSALEQLRVDVALVGTNGISLTHGLSTPDPEEAAAKRALVAAARRVVVLADASKLGVEATVRFASLEDVDTLVTDATADPGLLDAFTATDLEVVRA